MYVLELMKDIDANKPKLIGAVLHGSGAGPASSPSYLRSTEPGASLWAAHLPGVNLHTFAATQSSLPALPPGTWPCLMQASALPRSSPASVATLLMSAPHFVGIEDLVQRLGSILPGAPVIGGVSSPGAWGQGHPGQSNWGAVYVDEQILAKGAAGCIMHGNFQVSTALEPGFQPLGAVRTVTAASRNLVLELDGLPASEVVQRDIQDLLGQAEGHSIKLGIADSPGEDHVVRNWAFIGGGDSGTDRKAPLYVAVTREIPVGAKVQLHMQDFPHAHQGLQHKLHACAGRHPEQAAASAGSQGALVFPCSGIPITLQDVCSSLPPSCAVAGGAVVGEFGSLLPGSHAPRLHSFSCSVAMFSGSKAG